ncbi:hypothetical protein ACFCX0_24550 [Streptomyces sp. NPDC056352]|uniref:hypothetical protein n=1 Tax=Streptomyces sp. NPDC056352 TaxID=3345791 RepID=UPI0035D9FF7F
MSTQRPYLAFGRVKKGSATALRPWTGTYRVQKVTKPKPHAAPAQQTSGITG